MQHLFTKALTIDYPRFKVQGSNGYRILPPIVFEGSASYGPSVQQANDKHTECMQDATDATRIALEEGYRVFINGGAGFCNSIMHLQAAPSIGDFAINITNTTPHIAKAEGALPGIDQMLVARDQMFSLRKAVFGIAGVEYSNRGGSGTVDEFMDTILRMVYGEMSADKPLAFNSRHNFYHPVFDQLRLSEKYGYVPGGFVDRLIIGDKPRDLILATKDRLLSLTDEQFYQATHYRPHYRKKEMAIEFRGPYNQFRRNWRKGTMGAPVIALVTGRSVDENHDKRSARHRLTDEIDVAAIIKGIKAAAPNAVILFINEESRLAKRIHTEAQANDMASLGISAADHTGRMMYGTGTTKVAENSSLINSAVIDLADVIVPMDLSLRAQSIFWQSLVYAVIREPEFSFKEIMPLNKNGIYAHTEEMISSMIKCGVINPNVRNCYYDQVKDESALVENIATALIGKGKRFDVKEYPNPPPEKVAHVQLPPDDRVLELTPVVVRKVAELIQPPRDGNVHRHVRGVRGLVAAR